MSGVSFQNINTLPINDRVVRDDTGYKQANTGSLGSRLVNWLKETFFPGVIRQENIAAYEGARRDWAAQNGTETDEVTRFFDAHIAAGDRFTPLALDPIRQTGGVEMMRFVEADIRDLVEPGKPMSMFRDTGLADTFVADFPRATYVLNGEALSLHGVDPDGNRIPSNDHDSWVPGLEARLRSEMPDDLVAAVTHSAHQGMTVGIATIIASDNSPLVGPGGEQIRLMAPPDRQNVKYDLITEGDNVRVAVHVTFEQVGMQADAPYDHLAPGSRVDFFFDYVVEKDGHGGARVGEIGPLVVDSRITGITPAAV